MLEASERDGAGRWKGTRIHDRESSVGEIVRREDMVNGRELLWLTRPQRDCQDREEGRLSVRGCEVYIWGVGRGASGGCWRGGHGRHYQKNTARNNK